MIDQALILDIIKSLVNDKNAFKHKDLPSVLFTLLQPYTGKIKSGADLPADISAIVDRTIQDHGFCTNCRAKKTEKKSDSTCLFCKRQFKDACKKKIQESFDSL